MRRARLSLAVAALAAFFVVAVTAGGADTFTVRLVSQTSSTITLGWAPQPGYGYLFTAGGVLVSRTNDASRSSVKFSKVTPASYDVDVITKGANGHYPAPAPPAQCSDTVDNDGDGKVDLADPGCSGPTDNDETNVAPPLAACADGIDNDSDGKIDLADPGCSNSSDTDETDVPAGACAVATPNVPDGPDGKGGCFPGVANTGPNAPESSMAAYTGSCNITVANTTIDSKVIRCDITVGASGLLIKNSYIYGKVHGDGPSFTIQDSLINGLKNGYACIDCGVDNYNFTVLRTEIINTNRSAYCTSNCLIQDNYFHGTTLNPASGAHASAVREEQYLTLRHNSLSCDYMGPYNVNPETGCSADLTGYPDFAPVHHNTVDGNLFIASTEISFCLYGGGTSGKPYSGNAQNATYQVFTNNVFQRGTNNKCGAFGPGTDYVVGRTGNVWSGNVWSDGVTVPPTE